MPRIANSTSSVLALAVLASAGCAAFDPNPAATQQAAPPVTVVATPGAATSADATTVEVDVPDFLIGRAFVADTPLRNAPFTVLDALTDAPIAGVELVTLWGHRPGAPLKTDENGLILFALPKTYKGDLVRVAVQTPEGAYLNSLLAVAATPSGYRLAASTNGCGANGGQTADTGGGTKLSFTQTQVITDSLQTSYEVSMRLDMITNALDDNRAVGVVVNTDGSISPVPTEFISMEGKQVAVLRRNSNYRLTAANCNAGAAFKLDFTSTLSSSAMSGVLSLMKAGLADGRTVEQMLTAAQESSQSIDDAFGKNAASKKDAYETFQKDPNANQGFGLGLAFKQVEGILEAAGVPKGELGASVAETFAAILKTIQSNPDADLTNLTLTENDVPSILNLDLASLKTGNISYTDPITNTVVNVVAGDLPVDDTTVITEPDVFFEDEEDFISDPAKLAPTVTVAYDANDSTSPLRLTVEQANGTFDVKSIVASIPMQYVKACKLDAASPINDTTTVTNISGQASGWSTLTGGLPHWVTATSASDASFTGVWKFGASSPGTTKIADVSITKDTGSVKVTLGFALLNNNAITTKGGKVVMDILKSVIELNTTELDKLSGNNDNVVAIIIKSRAGTDLSPTTTDTSAAVNITRPVVR